MGLRYSFVIFVGIVIVLLLVIFKYKKRLYKYDGGKRIANTKYVKKIPFYQELLNFVQEQNFLMYLYHLIKI